MPVTVSDAGPFEKLIAFSVAEEEIESAKASTARRISRDMKIAGFRPGKAPRPVVERTVGRDRLRAEAIDDLLPIRVASVLEEADLEPAVSPALESLDEADDGVDVTVRVTLWPRLEHVPDHHDRTIEVGSPEVTDEELRAQIDLMRQQFGELEGRDGAARAADYLTLDISATRDGTPVEEASATQLTYELGSGGFLPGIDEALAEVATGETRKFEGELPDGFGEVSGESVTFEIVVTDVRKLVMPELTDEWVSEVSEFSSISELEVNLEERMGVMKRQAAVRAFRERALDELVEQVDVDIPEALIRSEMEQIVHRFVHRLERDDITLGDYLTASGTDQESFLADVRSQAHQGVRTKLLLEAIAEAEGLEVADEEFEAVFSAVFSGEDLETSRERLRGSAGEQSLVDDILRNKALDVILAEARPIDEDGEPIDLDVGEPESTPMGTPLGEPAGDVTGDVVAAIPAGIPLDEDEQPVQDDGFGDEVSDDSEE